MSVKKFLIIITAAFLSFSLYAQSLPNGYGGVFLGMSLDEAKKQLLKIPILATVETVMFPCFPEPDEHS